MLYVIFSYFHLSYHFVQLIHYHNFNKFETLRNDQLEEDLLFHFDLVSMKTNSVLALKVKDFYFKINHDFQSFLMVLFGNRLIYQLPQLFTLHLLIEITQALFLQYQPHNLPIFQFKEILLFLVYFSQSNLFSSSYLIWWTHHIQVLMGQPFSQFAIYPDLYPLYTIYNLVQSQVYSILNEQVKHLRYHQHLYTLFLLYFYIFYIHLIKLLGYR